MAMKSAKLTSSERVYIQLCFQFSNVFTVSCLVRHHYLGARCMLAMIHVVVAVSLPKPPLRLTACASCWQKRQCDCVYL